MTLNFKNRIAFHYMIATAIIMAIVFGSIFWAVKRTVLQNIDQELFYQAQKHTKEVKIVGDSIQFINKAEWEEREHREVQVNPVFIQLMNENGDIMDKSPNLKQDFLPFGKGASGNYFHTVIDNKNIRQLQLPIEYQGNTKGYILTAVSAESAISIITKLGYTLIISYFLVLAGLYFISRFLAGKSIRPVTEIARTISRITKSNLNERVTLPQHHDEIHTLSSNFNALLERIEQALKKEKQFTSDASHELRTPLATLRGTLEVLIRKPRSQQEYEEKIGFSLGEIERMANTIDQLLLLARLDLGLNQETTSEKLQPLLNNSVQRFEKHLAEKELHISAHYDEHANISVPQYHGNTIIDNLLSNAIKYSKNGATITIRTFRKDDKSGFSISDQGIGIKQEDLSHIYDQFFRSDALQYKHINGTGLGLTIVKKCVDAIQAEIQIDSKFGKGTKVTVTF
jgi:two-component system heavy metal sensor histidine kinase CusS